MTTTHQVSAEGHAWDRRRPKNCPLPDLSDLFTSRILDLTNNMVLGGSGRSPSGLVVSLVRLIDKSVWEYTNAREAAEDWVGQGGFAQRFETVAALENCVNSLHRTLLFAKAVTREKSDPRIGKDWPVLKKGVADQVRRFRGAIEHMDEEIRRGNVGPGKSMTIHMGDMEMELLGERISFDQLAGWIKQLHLLGEKVAGHYHHSVRANDEIRYVNS